MSVNYYELYVVGEKLKELCHGIRIIPLRSRAFTRFETYVSLISYHDEAFLGMFY